MDTDFEQDLAKVIDNQRAQTVFNRWKMRTTKDRAESSSSIGSITETAAEVQARFLIASLAKSQYNSERWSFKDGLSKTVFERPPTPIYLALRFRLRLSVNLACQLIRAGSSGLFALAI